MVKTRAEYQLPNYKLIGPHSTNNDPLICSAIKYTNKAIFSEDLLEVCFIALDPNFDVNKKILPFTVKMDFRRSKRVATHYDSIMPDRATALYITDYHAIYNYATGCDLLVNWLEEVLKDRINIKGKVKGRCNLIVLDSFAYVPWLIDWIGYTYWNTYFVANIRCIKSNLLNIKDRYAIKNNSQDDPFQDIYPQGMNVDGEIDVLKLRKFFGIQVEADNCLHHAIANATLYKKLLEWTV